MTDVDELIKPFKNNKLQHSVMIIFFKGEKLPKYCVPMPRDPLPEVDIPLTNNLMKIYLSAIKKNHSITDGAILIRVDGNRPVLKGFSYRIYPPLLNIARSKNKGSGYNSLLDFSGVKRVACTYFIDDKNVIRMFIKGKEIKL